MPTLSATTAAAKLIVTFPSVVGVIVAVYWFALTALKLLTVAFTTLTSCSAKPITSSLNTKVAVKLLSLNKLLARDDVMVTVGEVLSTTKVLEGPTLPANLVTFLAVLLAMLTPSVPSPVMFESVIVAVVDSPLSTDIVALAEPVLFKVIAEGVKFTSVTSE